MQTLKAILLRLRDLFRKEQLDRDLNAELSAQLDLHIEENLRAGMTPEEARRTALLKLGGVEQAKESVRDLRGMVWLETVFQDLRFGLRMLRKNPAFGVVAVFALALGIGFSSMVFSIFYNGVLHPFPYRDADRLAIINIIDTRAGAVPFRGAFHLDEIQAFRKLSHTVEDVAGVTSWDGVYWRQGFSEQIHGAVVTPNAMSFYGVAPLLGRGLTEGDALPDAPPVALLGYLYWKTHFNEDKSVIGQTMLINKQARTIIGVMPPRFFLFGADFYAPISWNRVEPSRQEAMSSGEPLYFFATAMVKKGVAPQVVDAELWSIAKGLVPLHKDDYPDKFTVTTRGFSEVIVGDFSQTLYLLIGSVVLLLFISSSNVACLLLVHTSARAKEISLRSTLGASRGRLARQLFMESVVLGAIGCLAGCLVAYWGLAATKAFNPGLQIPGEADIALNGYVLLFAVATSFVTTLLFGLSPVLFAVKKDVLTNLQGSGVNVNSSRRGTKMRAGLVVGQVAISMLLLIFAGLMVHSFIAVTNIKLGFDAKDLLIAQIHFPGQRYQTPEGKRAYLEPALARIRSIPGVKNAATSITHPVGGSARTEDVTIPGKPHEKNRVTAMEACSETYFDTVGLRLLRGRVLTAADVASARHVIVVNDTLAQKYFPGEDPIGHQIKFNVLDEIPEAPHDTYFEIIGVVSDFKNWELTDPVLPQAFLPYTIVGLFDRTLLVRTAANPTVFLNTIRQLLAEIDPDPMLSHPDTVEAYIHDHDYVKPRFRLISFGICAAIGLGLALIGLFGVMAYSVALQTHDIGIRMALGALPGNILVAVLQRGLLLVGSGVVIGLCAAFLSVRVLSSQLSGISTFDLGAFILAPLALLLAGLLACYLPARRATRVDPMIALRYE
jgi:putative ABC transport system permease protein